MAARTRRSTPTARGPQTGSAPPRRKGPIPLTHDTAGLPLAAAELAPVDDAGILVAGGAERDGAAHFAAGDRAFEAIGQVARLMAAAEAEANQISLERAGYRPCELRRALMPGQLVAALFERETVTARSVQEIYPQLPLAGDRRRWRSRRGRLVGQRRAERRDHGIADQRRLALLQLERIDRDRIVGRAVVVEHDADLPVEHRLAQRQSVEREAGAVPDDLEPRHPVNTLGLDDLTPRAVELRKALGDHRQIIVPSAPLDRGVARLEPAFERGDDADDVLLRHLHRPAQRLMRRAVTPGRFDQALAAEEEAAGLRPAQEFAAAVDDEVGAAGEPRARPLDVLGGRVDHRSEE